MRKRFEIDIVNIIKERIIKVKGKKEQKLYIQTCSGTCVYVIVSAPDLDAWILMNKKNQRTYQKRQVIK